MSTCDDRGLLGEGDGTDGAVWSFPTRGQAWDIRHGAGANITKGILSDASVHCCFMEKGFRFETIEALLKGRN